METLVNWMPSLEKYHSWFVCGSKLDDLVGDSAMVGV